MTAVSAPIVTAAVYGVAAIVTSILQTLKPDDQLLLRAHCRRKSQMISYCYERNADVKAR